jgi:integrase
MKKTRTKQRYGSGWIGERVDGRFEGRIRTHDGRRISFYGRSEKAVADQITAYLRDPSKAHDPENLTVGQWLDRWLDMVKADPRCRLATYKLYSNTVNKHLKPRLESIRLAKLSKADVYDMLDNIKTKKSKGDRTRQIANAVFHRAVQVAFKRDKVARNIVALVDKPSAAKKPKVFLKSEEEIRKFREAAIGSRYHILYITALDTGLRQGELLALKWGSVDLSRGLIHVRATLTRNDQGKLVGTKPKTPSSIRTVSLPRTTIELLKEHRKTQMGSKRGLSTWVFPNEDDYGPTGKDGFLREELQAVAKRAGIPGLSFHGLRHTHATMLAALGANIKAVQERLGHSTTRMTLDVYSHLTSTIQGQAVAALDEFYNKMAGNEIGGQIGGQTADIDAAQTN